VLERGGKQEHCDQRNAGGLGGQSRKLNRDVPTGKVLPGRASCSLSPAGTGRSGKSVRAASSMASISLDSQRLPATVLGAICIC
jgi:hypothetical protein